MRLFLLLPLLAALPASALADPLTFEAALAKSDVQAPSLRARAFDIDARRSAAQAAGQLPDPKLGVGLDNFPISGPPAFTFNGDSMTMGRLGISQDVPNLAKRKARSNRAEADIGVAEAERLAEARRVRIATALAWIDQAYAERRLAAIDKAILDLSAYISPATASVASGTARPAQSLEIRAAIAALQDQRSEVAAQVAQARAMLSRWTGDPNPTIAGLPPEFEIDPDRIRAAIEQHPDLAVAIARLQIAEANVTVARAEKRPDWGFDVAYQRRNGGYGDMVSAGVTVSLPLFSKRRQDPLIASSVATEGAALAQREDVRRALNADLDSALADHVMHHEQWMRARDTLLPLAREKLDLETASYSAGRAVLTDVIQAHTELVNAQLLMIDREATVVRDAARLTLTYGGD